MSRNDTAPLWCTIALCVPLALGACAAPAGSTIDGIDPSTGNATLHGTTYGVYIGATQCGISSGTGASAQRWIGLTFHATDVPGTLTIDPSDDYSSPGAGHAGAVEALYDPDAGGLHGDRSTGGSIRVDVANATQVRGHARVQFGNRVFESDFDVMVSCP